MTYICTQCGSQFTVEGEERTGACPVCQALFVLPNNFKQKENIYRLAAADLAARDYDAALSKYSRILKVDAGEFLANWGYLLAKYGIEISNDPLNGDQIIFHRLESSSFTSDPCYEKAIAYCPEKSLYYYRIVAERIDRQHRKMLEIAGKTKPFDIYINCVSAPGTSDYIVANQVGKVLDEAGYRVFLPSTMISHIPEGEKNLYEMAVAEKASAMIVVAGSETDYGNSRYTAAWKRFYAYRTQDATRKMLSVYRDIGPEQLPLELQPLQSVECAGGDFQGRVLGLINTMFGRQDRDAGLTREVLEKLNEGEQLLADGKFIDAAAIFLYVIARDAEESRAHWGVVRAATENLTKPVFSADFDNDFCNAVKFAQEAQKDVYRNAMAALMSDPLWNLLAERTADLRDTSVADTDGVKAVIERINLYFARTDSRFKILDDYRTRAAMAAEAANIVKRYKKRDAAAQPLFAEQTKAENDYSETKIKENVFAGKSGTFIRLTAVMLFCLPIAVILCLFRYSFSGFLNFAVSLTAEIFYSAGFLAMMGWMVSVVTDFTGRMGLGILGAVILTILSIFFANKNMPLTFMIVFAIAGVLLLVQRLMVLSAARNVKEGLSRQAAALERIKQIDARILEAYQADMRQLREKFPTVDFTVPEYRVVHSDNFAVNDRKYANIKPVPYIIRTVLIYAVLIAGVTLLSNFVYTSRWRDVVAVYPGDNHVVAMRADGSIIANGYNQYGQCNVGGWKDIVDIETGITFTAGLAKDGTVYIAGGNGGNLKDAGDWTDIISISASDEHLVGLKSDGTCVAVSTETDGDECNVSKFTNITKVLAVDTQYGPMTLALNSSGHVFATIAGEWETVALWLEQNTGTGNGMNTVTDIYGEFGAVILELADGTYRGVGANYNRQLGQLDSWRVSQISDVFVAEFALALKNDGSVAFSGADVSAAAQTANWKDITAIDGYLDHALALHEDGTVSAIGTNYHGKCDTDDWKNIAAVYAGYDTSFGLTEDRTVEAAGWGIAGMAYLTPRTPFGVLQFWIDSFSW